MSLKKNLKQEVSKSSDYEVFFFDESRFGTHSKSGHGYGSILMALGIFFTNNEANGRRAVIDQCI